MIPCINTLVFDGIRTKTFCIDLWNYNLVIRSGVMRV